MTKLRHIEKERKTDITSLEDSRLVLIDSSQESFFDVIINATRAIEQYYSYNNVKTMNLTDFLKRVKSIQKKEALKFWKPIMDPSIGEEQIMFKKGEKPATGFSFNWWKDKANKLPSVEGKNWSIGIEKQYTVFIIWLINQMIEDGWKPFDAIRACTVDSKELGNFLNGSGQIEETGSRQICGVYDLANTYKILNNEEDNYLLASGNWNYSSHSAPLSYIALASGMSTDWPLENSVGWLVLS